MCKWAHSAIYTDSGSFLVSRVVLGQRALASSPIVGFKPQMESPVFIAVPYYFIFHFTHWDPHSGIWIRGIKRRKEAEIQRIQTSSFKCNTLVKISSNAMCFLPQIKIKSLNKMYWKVCQRIICVKLSSLQLVKVTFANFFTEACMSQFWW